MKKLAVLFASMFIFAIAVQNVNAQTNVQASASSEATIITPLAIVKNVDLNFGNIVAAPTSGVVTVATNGTRSKTGGVTLPAATPGTISAAKFTVTGLANATYSITLPSAFNITRSGGTETMEVSAFVSNPTPTGLLTGGTQELFVGASVAVGANQAAGTYVNATALTITVAYN